VHDLGDAVKYLAELRKATDDELLTHLSGWRQGTREWLQVTREIRRREYLWPELRSWAAVVISLLALAVSVWK